MSEKENPKLRSDTKVSQISATEYELEHPETGVIFHLDGVGYLVAEQFESGDFSVPDVVKNLRENYALRLTEQQILTFLTKADTFGFLEKPLTALGITPLPISDITPSYSPQGKMEAAAEAMEIENQARGKFRFYYALSPKVRAFLAVAIVLFFMPCKQSAMGPLAIEPFHHVAVRSPTAGIISEVLVREGDHVKPNQTLATLSGFSTEIARKKTEIRKVEAELEKLRKGATKEELAEAEKHMELAHQIAKHAKEKWLRIKDLYQQGLVSQQDLEAQAADYHIKGKEMEKAEAALRLVRSGTRPEIIRAKVADREALLVDLKKLEAMDQRSVIRSPIDGIVATSGTVQMVGKNVNAGDFILEISDPTKITVKTYIRERDIGKLRKSKELSFRIQAIPNETFYSKVSRIAPTAEQMDENISSERGSGRYVRVYADMKNPLPSILPGMTGTVRIETGWGFLGFSMFKDLLVYYRVQFVL